MFTREEFLKLITDLSLDESTVENFTDTINGVYDSYDDTVAIIEPLQEENARLNEELKTKEIEMTALKTQFQELFSKLPYKGNGEEEEEEEEEEETKTLDELLN